VARLPVARDVLLDLIHAAGIVVRDPSRETLEACFEQFMELFEAGALSITRRAKHRPVGCPIVCRRGLRNDGANAR
jgi:hypothetical protein